MRELRQSIALIALLAVGGCGLYVPEKDFLARDTVDENGFSSAGSLETAIVTQIKCEITRGLWRVANSQALSSRVPWLYSIIRGKKGEQDLGWGTAVNLLIQVEEQGALSPGLSLVEPFHNAYNITAGATSLPLTPADLAKPTIAAISRSFTLGVGASASAKATRQETIAFTFENYKLLKHAEKFVRPEGYPCDKVGTRGSGILIESDLKIDDFIYDKATIAALGNVIDTEYTWAPFNTFQEQLTFVATFGGGVTPTWKFARATVNPSSNTASVQRADTHTVTITLGPLDSSKPATQFTPLVLGGAGATQHASGVAAALIGSAIKATAP
jgi:hypothetical protein